MRILILSGADHVRFPTMLNHKVYADRNGYRYRFDMAPVKHVVRPYFHKIAKIADALQDADWIFWIDDDAAFTQLETRLEDLVPEMLDPQVNAIFCKSPINPQGGWTHISSGNFLLRNSNISRSMLDGAIEALLPKVETWWSDERFGIFTNGDQDIIVYLIETSHNIKDSTRILEYERFNTRPYHFKSKAEHFLVHFTSQPGLLKSSQMQAFARSHGLSRFLLPDEDLKPYGRYPELLLKMLDDAQ